MTICRRVITILGEMLSFLGYILAGFQAKAVMWVEMDGKAWMMGGRSKETQVHCRRQMSYCHVHRELSMSAHFW